MKPLLYIDNRSPPVRSCLMLIKLLNIDVELKEVNIFKGEQLQEYYKKINPAHTVPTLIDDDLILTDSKAILIHFCEKYQKRNDRNDIDNMAVLWPKDYNKRMKILNMLLFEGTFLFRRDSDLMSDIIRRTYANIDIDYYQGKIFEVYDMLERYLTKSRYIVGNESITLADIAVITTLSSLDLIFSVYRKSGVKMTWPHLCDWFDHMKTLPIYNINYDGLMELKKSLELFGKFQINTYAI